MTIQLIKPYRLNYNDIQHGEIYFFKEFNKINKIFEKKPYYAIVANKNKNCILFKRLEKVNLFNNKYSQKKGFTKESFNTFQEKHSKNNFIPISTNEIYNEWQDYYEQKNKLDEEKKEKKRLKELNKEKKPYLTFYEINDQTLLFKNENNSTYHFFVMKSNSETNCVMITKKDEKETHIKGYTEQEFNKYQENCYNNQKNHYQLET